MLGLSIYDETKRDIQDLSDKFTRDLRERLKNETSILKAVQKANSTANLYHSRITQTVFKRLREVGANAVDYYGPGLDPLVKEQEVSNAIDQLVHNKHYGLTLPQRLKQSHLQLRRNIQRSSAVGAKLDTKLVNVTRVFNNKYPFGAHKHWDIRLFLAEAVRLEHVIALNLATRSDYDLVRWTLSHTHAEADVCDRLAAAVDPDVVALKPNIDPSGVYFINKVPAIPHPNCQCVLKPIHKKQTRRQRKPKKKESLIRRILRRIFK